MWDVILQSQNKFTTVSSQLGCNFGRYGLAVNTIITRHAGTYAGYNLFTSDDSAGHSGNAGLKFVL